MNHEYAVFYNDEIFKKQQSHDYYQDPQRKGKKNVIRYRLFLDNEKQPVDKLVIVTEAVKIDNVDDLDNILDEFYKKSYNSGKYFLGVGYWASSTPQ